MGEKCHAFSKLDQRIYEAKVLKAEFRQLEVGVPGQWFYFVHYAGWNKKQVRRGMILGSGMVQRDWLGMIWGGRSPEQQHRT